MFHEHVNEGQNGRREVTHLYRPDRVISYFVYPGSACVVGSGVGRLVVCTFTHVDFDIFHESNLVLMSKYSIYLQTKFGMKESHQRYSFY